jgi:branched-chain amino acid transport system substrate-binding protein
MRGRILRLAMGVLEAALAAALAVTLVGCSAGSGTSSGQNGTGSSSAEPIKIGAIVSLTGTYAGLGDPEKKTIEMEVKRINEAGGINGRPIEVIFEDDGTDEAKAVAAASKLIEQDKVVAIIGATGTGQSMAVRNEIDRAGIPQLSMAGGSAITAKLDPQVFQTPWSNKLVVPFTLAYLKKQGITKIGVISDTGGFGKDGNAVLAAEAPKAGVTVVSNQTFNPGDADMTAQLTNIKNSDAQAVVMWTSGKEAATVVKNAKQLGLTIPVYGSHGNARMEFVQGAGDAAEGFRFSAGKILLPESYGKETPEYKTATEFVDRYTKAYGSAPSTFAGHAYDALYLIAEAARQVSGELTPAALRDQIEKTKAFSGIGGSFTFSPTDHNGLTEQDLNMYEVKNGAWTIAP